MNKVNGILLIYHHPLRSDAATIMEHVTSFEKHSRFRVWKVNTALGFPKALRDLRFATIILHYSLFGWYPFALYEPFYEYVYDSRESYKIAFFQDEYRFWPERAEFLNTLDVDCVFTLLEPRHFGETYLKYTRVRRVVYNLPAYASDEAEEMGRKVLVPDRKRKIDVGYRGRQPAYYLGRGGQEKYFIAEEFKERAKPLGLRLDIETEEKKRIYGKGWVRFLANCRAVLGVEAGTSIFDADNVVRPKYEEICGGNPDLIIPNISFDEVHKSLLAPYEDKIYYRTISARHFEAAALRVCQILFEGKYSGILNPMVHYIPLKKDFSNFDEVIRHFRDRETRQRLTENAYNDLIVSDKYRYKRLISAVDEHLLSEGIIPTINISGEQEISKCLHQGLACYFAKKYWAVVRYNQFPGRNLLKPFAKPLLKKLNI